MEEQESASRNPAIALCHEWLTTFGGADQVAARLTRSLGIEDVFTFAAWDETTETLFPRQDVKVIGPSQGWARHHWQWLLPYMPLAWSRVDLSTYDLVITSAHACVNSIRPRGDARHLSYCHTPMRYAWQWRSEAQRFPLWLRTVWPLVAAYYRRRDRAWAEKVDLFLANSRFVADRIRSFYDKPSLVVHPPIDTSYWTPRSEAKDDYYLLSGRLVAYKRPELVIQAAAQARKRLIVAGSGPLLKNLRNVAGSNVTFVPNPSSPQLRDLYRRARAYVFAGVEDFGMSIVEAQACGTAVIAYARGGARETVVHNRSGRLVRTDEVDAFAKEMQEFDQQEFDSSEIRASALRFDEHVFDEKVQWVAAKLMNGDWQSIRAHPDWVAIDPTAEQT